jgi:hypothetical protein
MHLKIHINHYCLNTPLCRWPPCPSLYCRICDRKDVITRCCISWRFPRIHLQIRCFLVTYNGRARFMYLACDVLRRKESGTARSSERAGEVHYEPDRTWNLSTSTPATHTGVCSNCALNTFPSTFSGQRVPAYTLLHETSLNGEKSALKWSLTSVRNVEFHCVNDIY